MKLSTSAVLAAAVAVLPVMGLQAAEGRTYVGGRFSLELGGHQAGVLKSFTGGGGQAEVVTHTSAQDLGAASKAIANPTFEDIKILVGPGQLSQSGSEWLVDSFNGTGKQSYEVEGAIVLADHDFNARRRVSFQGAYITEIAFPALDGRSKEPGYFGVTISPGNVDLDWKASGKIKGSLGTKQKSWNPSNFRVKIGGLPCERVSKIESFQVTRKLVEMRPGEMREPVILPGRIEYPNLTLTISAVDIEDWAKWYEDFMLQGNQEELKGSIEFLGADLKEAFMTIELQGVGMKRFSPFPSANANADSAASFNVELYVEQMTLSIKNP
jgi:phage tail-like protein